MCVPQGSDGAAVVGFSMQMNRIWNRVGTLVLILPIVTACSQGGPTTVGDIQRVVDKTDTSICNLELQGFGVDVGNPDPVWAALLDYQRLVENGSGASLEKVYRRAALRRRLLAGDIAAPYDEFSEPNLSPPTLAKHLERARYWRAALKELTRDYPGNSNPNANENYNIKFCILNERGGAAYAAARQATLEAWEAWLPGDRQEVLDVAMALMAMPAPDEGAFARHWLSKLEDPDALTFQEFGALAMMRGPEEGVMPFDPKTVPEFRVRRMAEVEAALAYLDDQDWPIVADELAMRVRLDQSLRSIFRRSDHFEPESWRENRGAWDVIVRTDRANTARLKELLVTRDWFRDDRDGDGAASDAWLLIQHADRDPDFQREILPRIEAAIEHPGVSASDYAYLFDRVAGKDGKPQRYGSQGRCIADDVWAPNAVEDPDRLNERRAEVGLGPIEDYILRFEGRCKAPVPTP